METEKFRQIVTLAIDDLPDEFRNALDNIEIVIEDNPSQTQIKHFEKRGAGKMLLLGLYQGIPKGKRDPQFYSGVLPDKITLFKKSIEEYCNDNELAMIDQIQKTLLHEIGHYFGMKDKELRKLGY